ncbi:hypothetical protein GCM10011613_29960 [Cellvibrio zantedeschiae]|uniref:SIMPL domain-containing protein n=1 Tax=Cellvibrio zantedeschiae TaxID=1237077 RepID=A0ABQ3B8B7_9GAMM|nr:hypothetical protein [Cellvibrio zantedeschiae]GGY83107.1 hypothetical protein GCM10011613_29960 [Cellvibrio zantedeschiae]
MKLNINLLIGASILSLSLLASAQDAEEIVVTGLRANDYNELPAITFSKKADFLVQQVELINDSRSPDLRKSEILQTIKNLISASKKIRGIELSYGKGFLSPINLDDESLQILDDKRSSDTSHIQISIKIAITEKESAKAKIEELKKFLKNANLVGRTEIENNGDIGLSIVRPEQYRSEILSLIAKENTKLKESLGSGCYTENEGLSGRVAWDRTAVDELVLYIRYSTKVVCK